MMCAEIDWVVKLAFTTLVHSKVNENPERRRGANRVKAGRGLKPVSETEIYVQPRPDC